MNYPDQRREEGWGWEGQGSVQLQQCQGELPETGEEPNQEGSSRSC